MHIDDFKKMPYWCLASAQKMPFSPKDGQIADVRVKGNFTTYAEARKAQKKYNMPHIGFVFFEDSQIIGIDIDKCFPDEPSIWRNIADSVQSYTEISTSGNGIHILCMGEWQDWYKNRKSNGIATIEMYNKNRFFIITENRIEEYPSNLLDTKENVLNNIQERWLENYKTEAKIITNPSDIKNSSIAKNGLSNEDIIMKIQQTTKGRNLWNGIVDDYFGDWSSADMALMCMLAFWTGKDGARMRELFSYSGLGVREKWQKRADYQKLTITNAIKMTTSTYNGNDLISAETYNIPSSFGTKHDVMAEIKLKNFGYYEVNDEDLAQMCADHLCNSISYNVDNGCWFFWTGKVWRIDDKEASEVRKRIEMLLKKYLATLTTDADLKASKKYKTARGKLGIVEELKTKSGKIKGKEIPMAIKNVEFDKHEHLINTPAGIINLKTGELIGHNPAFMMTKITKIAPKFGENCDGIMRFLNTTFQNNKAMIDYVLSMFGYFLTAETKEQKFFIFQGRGNDGKSTLMRLFNEIIGDDYGMAVPSSLVTNGVSSNQDVQIANISNKRYAVVSELKKDAEIREDVVKQLTGGDMLQARFLYQNPFNTYNKAKIVIITNYPPIINGEKAIWRRVVLIHFKNSLEEYQVERGLEERLMVELPAFFGLLIQYANKYYIDGLQEPAEVAENKQIYKEEESLFEGFLARHVVKDAKTLTPLKDFYEAFKIYLYAMGEDEKSIPKRGRFYKEFTNYGFRKEKVSQLVVVKGYRLATANELKRYDDEIAQEMAQKIFEL